MTRLDDVINRVRSGDKSVFTDTSTQITGQAQKQTAQTPQLTGSRLDQIIARVKSGDKSVFSDTTTNYVKPVQKQTPDLFGWEQDKKSQNFIDRYGQRNTDVEDTLAKVDTAFIQQYMTDVQKYAQNANSQSTGVTSDTMEAFLEKNLHDTYDLKVRGEAIRKYLEQNPNAYGDKYQSLMDYVTSSNDGITQYRKSLNQAEDEILAQKRAQDPTWFQTDNPNGANFWQRAGATMVDVGEEIGEGAMEVGEKVVDFGAMVAGTVGGWFGADDFRKKTDEFVAKDLYDSEKLIKEAGKYIGYSGLLNLMGVETESASILGEKSEGLANSAGQLALTAGMAPVVPWWVTSGATSFGAEAENALNQGATHEEAMWSASISAASEILTEKLFGGSGLGEKGLINLEPLTKGISNKLLQTLAKYGVDMASEGLEEAASELAGNLASALYKEENLAQLLTSEEALQSYLEAFVGGAVMSGTMNLGSTVSDVASIIHANQNAQKLYGTDPGALITESLEIDPNNAYAQKMQDRLNKGKRITGNQLNQMVQKNEAALKAKDLQAIQDAAQSRLEALGEPEGAKAIAEAIAKKTAGQELSVADELLIHSSKYAQRVLNELNAENIRSGDYASDWTGNINTERVNTDVYNRNAPQSVDTTTQRDYDNINNQGGTLGNAKTQDMTAPETENAVLYNKRDGEDGWGNQYATAQEALNDAVQAVDSELWNAINKEVDGSVDVQNADTPMTNALIAVQEDVRQEAITPMQGARLLSEAYKNGGEKALRSLYNSSTGNLYSNYLEMAKQYESNALVKRSVETKAKGSTLPETAVGAMKSRFEHEVKRSKLYDNTFKNAASEEVREIGKKAELFDENVANYEKLTNAESMMEAKLRTRSTEEIDFEYEDLINKDGWGASDNDTAWLILDYLSKNKDYAKFVKLANKQREQATRAGQLTQSFRKYKMSPVEAAAQAAVELSQMEQQNVPKKFWKKQGFEQWKQDVGKTIMEMQQEIDGIEDGDVSSMRKTIESLAKFRKTTAWYGMSSKLAKVAQKALAKVDFQTAKDIAAAQLSKIPNDFARRSVGQVVKTIKIQNMLSALTTINRNLIGNASIGIMDATSDSTVARALDALMSKATGKRTVGNDVRYAKEYFSAAKKSAEMGALCAELDIPMDSESRFSTGSTRTFSPQGGPVTRFLSGYEKYMKYSLEVTDKFFEGGAESAVEKSLRALGEKSNLTEEEIAAISESVGERRTFKEKRALYNAAKKVKSGLNEIGGENLGLGDLVIPFAGTGSNVTQAAIDYTSFGLGGFKKMLDVMNKARKGQAIDVVEQRQAVANAARGLTGTTLVAAFTALAVMGALKVHDDDDKDKRGLLQSENLSGAQLNISAAIRAISGESADWQKDDWVISVDFLEPFNAQMYVGYLLAQEESATEALKSYPKNAFAGVAQSVLDMPMMQGLSDVVDLADSVGSSIIAGDEDALENAAGQVLGNQASGFIPSWMRQTAQFIDPYYRDTTGDGALEKAVNQFIASVPFASETLPKKYSGLGEEQLRYENAAIGFFNTFINPGDIDQIKPSEITKYLNQLSERTGKNTMYPSATAPNSFTYKDENGDTVEFKISGKADTEKYQKTYGQTISSVYSDLISNEYFKSLDDKTQLDIFRLAEDYAKEKAKDAVSGYGSFPKYITEKPESMSIVEAIMRNKLVGSLERFEDKSVQEAARLVSLIDEAIDGLTPQSGYESVRTVQKVSAITAADDLLTAQEQADALRDILSDGFGERYDKVIAMGYDNDDFAKVYSIYTQAQDSKDIGKDDALKMIMRELNITKSQARKLYDAYTSPKDKLK